MSIIYEGESPTEKMKLSARGQALIVHTGVPH